MLGWHAEDRGFDSHLAHLIFWEGIFFDITDENCRWIITKKAANWWQKCPIFLSAITSTCRSQGCCCKVTAAFLRLQPPKKMPRLLRLPQRNGNHLLSAPPGDYHHWPKITMKEMLKENIFESPSIKSWNDVEHNQLLWLSCDWSPNNSTLLSTIIYTNIISRIYLCK